jgi:hypothetical protein
MIALTMGPLAAALAKHRLAGFEGLAGCTLAARSTARR